MLTSKAVHRTVAVGRGGVSVCSRDPAANVRSVLLRPHGGFALALFNRDGRPNPLSLRRNSDAAVGYERGNAPAVPLGVPEELVRDLIAAATLAVIRLASE